MSDLNLQPETNGQEAVSAKKKCCGKIKDFFTKESKEGKRVYNWKFAVLVVAVIAIVWIVL